MSNLIFQKNSFLYAYPYIYIYTFMLFKIQSNIVFSDPKKVTISFTEYLPASNKEMHFSKKKIFTRGMFPLTNINLINVLGLFFVLHTLGKRVRYLSRSCYYIIFLKYLFNSYLLVLFGCISRTCYKKWKRWFQGGLWGIFISKILKLPIMQIMNQ